MAEGFPALDEVPIRTTLDPELKIQAFEVPTDVNRIKHPFRMVISGNKFAKVQNVFFYFKKNL
jgi:hypothetical protein